MADFLAEKITAFWPSIFWRRGAGAETGAETGI
jgi:hypothetical protein